jgi:hypothetical protein
MTGINMKKQYGTYEQVNGGVVNDLNDKLDKAIELLTECSSELFINASNVVLEQKIDLFLNEHGKCTANCEKCQNCPASLKHQAN